MCVEQHSYGTDVNGEERATAYEGKLIEECLFAFEEILFRYLIEGPNS